MEGRHSTRHLRRDERFYVLEGQSTFHVEVGAIPVIAGSQRAQGQAPHVRERRERGVANCSGS